MVVIYNGMGGGVVVVIVVIEFVKGDSYGVFVIMLVVFGVLIGLIFFIGFCVVYVKL